MTTYRFADGAALIAAEREAQKALKGWTPEHDDQHGDGQLARAALGYTDAGLIAELRGDASEVLRLAARVQGWGWPRGWTWRPSDDPVRNLVKAGALIAAEIDRLLRAALAAEVEKTDG